MLLYHSLIPLIITIPTITIPLRRLIQLVSSDVYFLTLILCLVLPFYWISTMHLQLAPWLTQPNIRHKQTYIPSLPVLRGLARVFLHGFLPIIPPPSGH